MEIINTAVTGPIRDTVKFGDPTVLPWLVKSGEIAEVQRAARERYGVELPDAYCRDLIAFVEELTREPRD